LRLCPRTHLELAALLGGFGVDAGFRQLVQTLHALAPVDDLDRTVTCIDAFRYEGQQDLVRVVGVVKKSADATTAADRRARTID
jgi:hypothetical protein